MECHPRGRAGEAAKSHGLRDRRPCRVSAGSQPLLEVVGGGWGHWTALSASRGVCLGTAGDLAGVAHSAARAYPGLAVTGACPSRPTQAAPGSLVLSSGERHLSACPRAPSDPCPVSFLGSPAQLGSAPVPDPQMSLTAAGGSLTGPLDSEGEASRTGEVLSHSSGCALSHRARTTHRQPQSLHGTEGGGARDVALSCDRLPLGCDAGGSGAEPGCRKPASACGGWGFVLSSTVTECVQSRLEKYFLT